MKTFVGEVNIKKEKSTEFINTLMENGYLLDITPNKKTVNIQICEEIKEPVKGPFDEMDKIVDKFNKDLEEMLNDITRK